MSRTTLSSKWENLETRSNELLRRTPIETLQVRPAPGAEEQPRISHDVQLERSLHVAFPAFLDSTVLPHEIWTNHRIHANQNRETSLPGAWRMRSQSSGNTIA